MKTKIILLTIMLATLGLSNLLKAQAPTQLISGVGNATMLDVEAIGNTFYFKVTNGAYKELWKTDGTVVGTQLVKDSFPVDIVNFVNINGMLYFIGTNSSNTTPILWKSDGTNVGTIMVKVFTGSSQSVGALTAINNVGYFTYSYLGPSYAGTWKTDGTDPGTVEVISNITTGSAVNTKSFFEVGSDVVFFGTSAAPGYRALWKTDGTAIGTTMIKDSIMKFSLGNALIDFININGISYFTISSGAGFNLWRTDGTSVGTFILTYANITSLTNFNGTLYFKVFSTSPVGYNLMKSDGTVIGTVAVSGVGNIGSGMASMGNNLYLAGKNSFDFEPYKSDGTATGTVLLKDINAGTTGSNPQYLTAVNSTVCFVADNGINGNQIWKTDGTSGGTVMAYALIDTIPNFATVALTSVGNYLLFISGNEMYSLLVSSSVGINDELNTKNIATIYPNPSKGIFQIKNDGLEISAIEIYNLLGEKIYSSNKTSSSNFTIDISNQSKGIYFVKIYAGEKSYTNKIIVQ